MKHIRIEDIDELPEKKLAELLKFLAANHIEFKVWEGIYIGD